MTDGSFRLSSRKSLFGKQQGWTRRSRVSSSYTHNSFLRVVFAVQTCMHMGGVDKRISPTIERRRVSWAETIV
jgi:hypothetical protein